MSQDFDLLIVGGGAIGCTLALALAETPLRIGLVESASFVRGRDWEPKAGLAGFDLRVNALSPGVRRYLQRLGVWQLLDSGRVCPFSAMQVEDSEGSGSIHFSALETAEEALGWIVEARALRAALRERLENCPAVRILGGTAVKALRYRDRRVCLRLEGDGEDLCAGLVAACDGPLSGIREMAGFFVREQNCHQRAIVAAVRVERAHEKVARQVFLPTGPLAFLPLSGGAAAEQEQGAEYFCSIVWSLDTEEASRLYALSDMGFCRELERAFEYRLGKVLEIGPRASYPLWQRHAREYFHNQVVLVGDALHVIHPLAGQGLNLGIRDVAVLSEELQRSLASGWEITDTSALRRYRDRRRLRNEAMLQAMTGLRLLFGSPIPIARVLRNIGMDFVARQRGFKRFFMEEAMGMYRD